VYSLH